VAHGLTTATFHIATPYPGTEYYKQMQAQGRLTTHDWDLYDTRQVVFEPKGMTREQLQAGYDWAYEAFYSWSNIAKASQNHAAFNQRVRHFAYSAGWKKAEPLWNFMIQHKLLSPMRQVLETVLDGRTPPTKPRSQHALEKVL
jgi:radical SAM superfamily enzyme YgiQ (UPF0313 family)